MAVTKQQVVLEVTADTTQVTKSIDNVDDSIKDTSQATAGLTGQLDTLTGGAVTGFAKMGQGLKTAVGGFKSLRVAVAATGIGLLIVAFTSLLSFFTKTERGAQQLRKITATLGAVMDKVADVAILLGEKLFAAFQNPQQAIKDFANLIKENIVNRFEGILELIPQLGKAIGQLFKGDFAGAAKTAADAAAKVTLGVEGITDKVAAATQAAKDYAAEVARVAQEAANLAQRENDLKVAERDFLTVRAETNKLIAEKRLLVEDEKLSFEERIGALDEALAAEQRTIDKELEFAKERAAILAEQAALAESDEATKQAVAEAEAQVIELQTRSLKAQKRLEGERQSLLLQKESREKAAADAAVKRDEAEAARIEKQEAEAEKARLKTLEAQQKLEDELYAASLTAREREELALMQKYDERIAIAGDDEGLIRQATENFLQSQAALEAKYEQAAKDEEQKKLDELQAYYDAANELTETNEQAQQEKELADLDAKYAQQIAFAQSLGQDTTALLEAQRAEEASVNKKYDDLERQRRQALANQRVDLAMGALGALAALNDAFGKKDDQNAERAFKRNKAIALATATLNTGQAVVNALTAGGNPIKLATGAQFVEAGIAAATGAAQIANISRTQYEAPAPPDTDIEIPPTPTLSAASTGGAATGAPQLDLSFLGAGAEAQAPVQAFVISQDVTTAQQANQQIQEQASL